MLTPWAEKTIKESADLTIGWSVCGIGDAQYQVHDFKSGGIVDLRERTCSCRVWQLTGLPCGHVVMVLTFLKQETSAHMALDAYKVDTYVRTYEECVYPIPEPRNWVMSEDMMIVRAPIMEKSQVGRPKNTNRIPSQGEEPIIRVCGRCGERGHNSRTCTSYVPLKKKQVKKGVGHRVVGPKRRKKPQQDYLTFDFTC